MKWVGLVCIVLGGIGIGRSYCKDYENRILYLEQISSLLKSLHLMVEQDGLPLAEAIGRCAMRQREEFRHFLEQVAKRLEDFDGQSPDSIWQEHAQELETVIPKQDYVRFCGLMSQTGFSQAMEQGMFFAKAKEENDEILLALKKQKQEKCKLYNALGILAAAFLGVLLI